MSISKKLFVLLLVAMILSTVASVTLVLGGHEDLVRDAFRWLTSSAQSVAETALTILVIAIIVVAL